MAKYIIDSDTLDGLANALRSVTGETRSYTPVEMIEAVTNIMETGTYILVDVNGSEVPAVFVEQETRFTANADDIRIGTTAVTDGGITHGTKEIPGYIATEGYEKIPAGAALRIEMFSDKCEYTKLQAIVCAFDTSVDASVSAEKVSINGAMYNVGSTVKLADVAVDSEALAIDFSLVNESNKPVLIRFFTYKEVY